MKELQIKLDQANKQLSAKMAVLQEAKDKVIGLQNQMNQMKEKKKNMERELQLTKDRLERAAALTVLTKD